MFTHLFNHKGNTTTTCVEKHSNLAQHINDLVHPDSACKRMLPSRNVTNKFQNGDLEIVQKNEEKTTESLTLAKEQAEKNPKKGLNAVLNRLCNKPSSQDKDVSTISYNNDKVQNKIVLEKISTNAAGVFQTLQKDSAGSDLMKTEVMEIHDIFASTEAVLGPDGKTVSTQNTKKNVGSASSQSKSIICTICNLKFSTKKTLSHHVKYKHNEIRVIYSCPECKDTFANAWSVFRHLYKVHHKNTSQIRKLRDQVHANAIEIKRNLSQPQSPTKSASVTSFDQENQWINDVERDYDLQMCGGCGKRFERKAALNSHSHLCVKRMAVYNKLKKNKRVDIEDNCKRKVGAQKRKGKSFKKAEYTDIPTEVRTLERDNRSELRADRDNSDDLNSPLANLKSENNQIDLNKRNLRNNAIEEIIFGGAQSDTIVDSHNTIIAKEDNKIEQLSTRCDNVSTDNIVAKNVPEVDNQPLKTITSYECNSSNYKDDIKAELKSCEMQTLNNTENNFSCTCDNNDGEECQLKSSNLVVHNTTTDHLYDTPKKRNKLPSIFKKCETFYNNRNMKCDILPNNNNNNNEIEVQNIEKCLIERVEEENKEELLQNYLDLVQTEETRRNTVEQIDDFIGIKKEFCEIRNEMSKSESDKIDNITEIHVGVSGECDTKQNSENEKLFSLYDDNSGTNFEFPKGQVKMELNSDETPNLKCDAAYPAGENLNDTCDIKSKKRKSSSDEENELDDTNLEIKSMKYINAKKLRCLPCNLTFISKTFLLKHMSLHFNWFCFQCSKCSFMSYDKQTCIKHAEIHNVESKILDNIVLPIPHWKSLNLCTSFNDLSQEIRSESEGVVKPTKKVVKKQKKKSTLSESNKNDPMLRKMIMEVIFGSESRSQGNGSKSEPMGNVRPVRNRTSIQKIQKDFVYDMKQIDVKAKEKKSVEAKVKPIKIIKGMDTHFKVVRTVHGMTYKKRKKIVE